MSEPEKSIPGWERWLSRLVLLLLVALSVGARTHNRADVFRSGDVYFIEGDCYSRMTRVKMVADGQLVIRHHDFENWPAGTTPHTTAPLDWIIAGMGFAFRPFSDGVPDRDLELAGAWISPLFGIATVLWLWWWAGRLRLPYRVLMIFFFALSPILVHGTLLGRPDHQSMLVFLLAIAIGAELALADSGMSARRAKKWSLLAGLAWGLSLWTSLYEPAVCFAGAIVWHAITGRMGLTAKAVRPRWIALGSVLLVALLIDGWRFSLPEPALRDRLVAWSRTIGELKMMSLFSEIPLVFWLPAPSKTPFHWFGMFWLSAPVLLVLARKMDRRSLSILGLLVVMFALTVWQRRWGYFSALAVAMSIPWQLGALRVQWLGWVAGFAAMIPVSLNWADRLHPALETREAREEKREQDRAVEQELRRIALLMRSAEKRPFLAVWWQSPQLAYWSGQPGIAGTSHQSFPGIFDSARFFLSDSENEGAGILRERGVRYVIIHDLAVETDPRKYPAVINSANILGADAPPEPIAFRLAESPRKTPPWLRFVTPKERGLVLALGRKQGDEVLPTSMEFYVPQFFQLYEVQPEQFPKTP